jgi:hypothetical protein
VPTPRIPSATDPADEAYENLRTAARDARSHSNSSDWACETAPFRTVPPQVLLRAVTRFIEENREGAMSTLWNRKRAVLKIASCALDEFCSDDELVTALGAFTAREPSLALALAHRVGGHRRRWTTSDLAELAGAGTLTKELYAALYYPPSSSALSYVVRRLAPLNPYMSKQRDLATTLFDDWDGSLDSLIDTARALV